MDKTDAYQQAAAHQRNQLSKLNQGSVAVQLETYQPLVKNGGPCTGSAKLSSKDREDDISHTRDPSSNSESRRLQVAATRQKRKLQLHIQLDSHRHSKESSLVVRLRVRVRLRVQHHSRRPLMQPLRPSESTAAERQACQGKLTDPKLDLRCLAAQKIAVSHGLSGEVHMIIWQVSDAFFILLQILCCHSICTMQYACMLCFTITSTTTSANFALIVDQAPCAVTILHCSSKHMHLCMTRMRPCGVPKLGGGVC